MNPIIFSILLSFAAASNAIWQEGEVIVEGGVVCHVDDCQKTNHNTLVKKAGKKADKKQKKIDDNEMKAEKAVENDAKK